MKQFIVHWHAERDGFLTRGGYTVVSAADKRSARSTLRRELFLERGEKIRISRVESV